MTSFFSIYFSPSRPTLNYWGGSVSLILAQRGKRNKITLVEIGCGTGSLLNELNKHNLETFGYEPSPAAYRMAIEHYHLKNIKNNYFASNTLSIKPDVFLLYDVIEHLDDPLTLLKDIKDKMGQHSIVIVKSGDACSINALLYPPKWRYYHMNQHIMFFSKRALDIIATKAALKITNYYRFKHAYGGFAIKEFSKNLLKAFIFRLGIKTFIKEGRAIALSNDHFISVFKLGSVDYK